MTLTGLKKDQGGYQINWATNAIYNKVITILTNKATE